MLLFVTWNINFERGGGLFFSKKPSRNPETQIRKRQGAFLAPPVSPMNYGVMNPVRTSMQPGVGPDLWQISGRSLTIGPVEGGKHGAELSVFIQWSE